MSINVALFKEKTPENPKEFLKELKTSEYGRMICQLYETQFYNGSSPIVINNKKFRKRVFPINETRCLNSLTKLYDRITNKSIQISYTDYDWTLVGGISGIDSFERIHVIVTRHEDTLPEILGNQEQQEFCKTVSEYLTQRLNEKTVYRQIFNPNTGRLIHEIHLKRMTDNFVETLQTLLPVFYKEYISEENTIKYDILSDALSGNETFKEKLFTLLKDYDNPERILKKVLEHRTQQKIEQAERDRDHYNNQLINKINEAEHFKNQIKEIDLKIKEYQLEKELGNIQNISRYTEIIDYIKNCYENMTCQITTDNNILEYNVSGIIRLRIFDEDAAERIYNRRFVELTYKDDLRFTNPKDFAEAKALFKALFIDRTLEINTYVNFLFDTERYAADTPRTDVELPTNCIEHPHLTRFNCWGNHQSAFLTFKPKDDLIGAITQAMYATQQISLTDHIVLNHTLKDVIEYCRNTNCLYIVEENKFDSWENLAKRFTEYPEPENEETDELELNEESTEEQIVGVTDPINRPLTEGEPIPDTEAMETFLERELLRIVEDGIQDAMEATEHEFQEDENED